MSDRRIVNATVLAPEITFLTSRSSGPGGQNVNKVNSKVTLKFDVAGSTILTAEEKNTLLSRLSGKLTTEGVVVLSSQDKRSQLQNRESVLYKFEKLIRKAFEKKKSRKATKPSKAAKEKRIKEKKVRAEKKQWRQKL